MGTHYQLSKLLQLCEFPEWNSSTKAGNVTENMKLDFNEFDSGVFSVDLYPIFYCSSLCEFYRECYGFISAS